MELHSKALKYNDGPPDGLYSFGIGQFIFVAGLAYTSTFGLARKVLAQNGKLTRLKFIPD